ncbi:cryptochrome/photolyase family protein [Natrinema ejinorense]|uniref:Deoxyribodipyrimidine photolyase n=1 Tax=Natrinema ejinorense TaxID=373386 RepID=A0A2A5R0T5_9EURY|nr:deoxyribodipyrimidine photo-lyase [Natrinema ejinorense]PCR92654.1 deoxyribodipyrimidine photolyase [Natrinema ejinorense]
MRLHWHRRDLRVTDNPALAGDDRLLPVFVHDPAILAYGAPPVVSFLLGALDSLREQYRERGGELLLARGDPRTVLSDLAEACDADAVTWNRDYSGLASERDRAVAAALADAGVSVDVERFGGTLLHEPETITTADESHYSVFSDFLQEWRNQEKTAPVAAPVRGDVVDPRDSLDEEWLDEASGAAGPLPSLAELGFDDPNADVQPAGTDVAHDLLADFREDTIYRYGDDREYPARESTSRLSPHLKFGTVGIRAVWKATEDAAATAGDGYARESVETFQRRLAWREFYAHVLDARPDVVIENYREYPNEIQWRDDLGGLRAWKDGETGYPLVDAGMRQLRDEAWVHNRVRMVAASFLTKDLLIDWREGYDWYRRKLADHDTAHAAGGWQWAASTGTNAQPYFRFLSPVTQSKEYDPDGEYVREHVPELRDAPTDAIHEWPILDDEKRAVIAPDYTEPIVDYGEHYERAIEAFEAARGDG